MKPAILILLLTITVCLLFSLSGCGNKQPAATQTAAPAKTSAPAPPAAPSAPSAATPTVPPDKNAAAAISAAEQLYQRHFKEGQAFEATKYQQWLDAELFRLLRKDEEESAKITDEIAGLDFDPLTNAQDNVGPYTISVAASTPVSADLNVSFAEDQQEGRAGASLVLQMVKNGDKWQIKNILYPSTDSPASDLISILKESQQQRDQMLRKQGKGK